MKEQYKNVLLGAAALIVVLAGYVAWHRLITTVAPVESTKNTITTSTLDIKNNDIPSPAVSSTEKMSDTVQPPKTAFTPKNYGEALNYYRSLGAYFQLVKCSSTPGMISLKKGVKFMVDNRDAVAHKIGLGKTIYTVRPYGYLVLVAPGTDSVPLTCDGGGSAMLNVEK